jgi:hypothetical protein
MKSSLCAATLVVFLVFNAQNARAETAAPTDLVQQVQAANLLADLITYTVDRADAQLKEAQAYLQRSGKLTEYQQSRPSPATPRPLNYMLLFRGALAFVEGDGAKYADQSVQNESAAELYEELTAAQYYNMHEFLHFNQQRRGFLSVQAYLKSIGEYDDFMKSTGDTIAAEDAGAGPGATQPAPATPLEVAQRMGDVIHFIKETAWKEAQAKGTSRADFDEQWPEQVKQYRAQVIARMADLQPNDDAFGTVEIAGTAPPPASQPAQPDRATAQPQVIYVTAPNNIGANHQLPPPVNSPYTNELYRQRDRSLWYMWDFNRRN